MATISAEQFLKGGKTKLVESTNVFQPNQQAEPDYLQRVGTGLKNVGTGLIGDIGNQFSSGLAKGATPIESAKAGGRTALRLGGAAAQVPATILGELPGVKQVTEFVGEKLAGTAPMEQYAQWSQKHPEAAKDIGNILDIVGLLTGLKGGSMASKTTSNVVRPALETAGEAALKTASGIGEKAVTAARMAPESIMTRVARLNPTDENKFVQVAGKSIGQYLTETGNFGDPESIITNEAKKFIESRNSVDQALASLPGEYKAAAVNDALAQIVKKSGKVSSANVQAPFSKRALELFQKNKQQGLTMTEINEVKRLFEREVKLGYNKALNPDLVQKATNIDTAIRRWQVEKADYLGFTNIRELNKQTQIAKFLSDKLGAKVIGDSALNNLSLTDYIILGSGEPSAISALLAKRFFSSKSVQARIAKLLNKGQVSDTIKAKTIQPAGLLEGPKQINLPGQGILEGQSKLRPGQIIPSEEGTKVIKGFYPKGSKML